MSRTVLFAVVAVATAVGCGPAMPPAETPAEQGETLAVPEWITKPGEGDEDSATAQQKVFENVVYATVDGHELQLDLFLPKGSASAPYPLVIWIHGGGWRSGSRKGVSRKSGPLLESGFAVASIDYRLTDRARFPAQIRDCLAAVRFLRANAERYGLDPDRFGVWGASAGGHLAAMVGLAAGIQEFNAGPHAEVSAEVQAVCDWFGPTDLVELHAQMGTTPATDHLSADSAEGRLVGGPIDKEPYGTRALEASPLRYAREGAPPFLIMHGDKDQVIPLEQSASLHRELVDHGVESTFHTVRGAGHGFKVSAKRFRRLVGKVVAFFEKHLMR